MTYKLYSTFCHWNRKRQKDGIKSYRLQGGFNLFPFLELETLKRSLKKKTITDVSRLRNFANKILFFLYTTQAQGLKI